MFSTEVWSLSIPMVRIPIPPSAMMLVRIAAIVTAVIFTRIECMALPPGHSLIQILYQFYPVSPIRKTPARRRAESPDPVSGRGHLNSMEAITVSAALTALVPAKFRTTTVFPRPST